MPTFWSQSRATALAVTLLLHAVAAIWLLSARRDAIAIAPAAPAMIWLPAPPAPPVPPPAAPIDSAPTASAAMPLVTWPREEPESNAVTPPDWASEARAVAREFGRERERRRLGPEPEQEPRQLRSQRPPHSVFERPLPRVGTTVRTPEGEQILWVSDNCYISLGSQSLTMGDFHRARNGVRRCNLGVGRRKARGDLFDPIRGPAQQEPGCGPGTANPFCLP